MVRVGLPLANGQEKLVKRTICELLGDHPHSKIGLVTATVEQRGEASGPHLDRQAIHRRHTASH